MIPTTTTKPKNYAVVGGEKNTLAASIERWSPLHTEGENQNVVAAEMGEDVQDVQRTLLQPE